jgi:hypothetical protein
MQELQQFSVMKFKPSVRSKSSTGKAAWQDEHGRFITAFTKAHPLCLSWATSIKNSQPNAGRFILILSSHVGLPLSNHLSPSHLPTKILPAFPSNTSDTYPVLSGTVCSATLVG